MTCSLCGRQYNPVNSFYNDVSMCPGCGDDFYDKTQMAMDVVERCLIHWFPDTPPSARRDAARSIIAALTVADWSSESDE